MPGPAAPGAARSRAVRGTIAAVLVIALVAAVTAALALRRDPGPAQRPSDPQHRAAVVDPIPTPAGTGAGTCIDPVRKQEWRVTWRAVAAAAPPATSTDPSARAAGVVLVPTGFAVRRLPGATPTSTAGWQSRDQEVWLLRWNPTLAETLTAAANERWSRSGPLATLAGFAITVRQSPRFVTPDGACSVYLAPFALGPPGRRNTVAVIGDSLLGQLYGSEDGTATGTGWLLNRMLAAGERAEIEAQGGRRWTVEPDTGSGPESADAGMLDEIRGLRPARAVVIALGTNDAGWVARAPDQEQYELRLAWVLLHLTPILDELRDHGHCTVLTTMATRNRTYPGSAPGRFEAAADRINDQLRQRAGADPGDRLKLWEWGSAADGHGPADPQPWFGADTIHLNQSGYGPYAGALASAASLC